MKIIQTEIPDVTVIEPRLIPDARGFFFEAYNERSFSSAGIPARFVQDNQSYSLADVRNTSRGKANSSVEVRPKLDVSSRDVGRSFDRDWKDFLKSFGSPKKMPGPTSSRG